MTTLHVPTIYALTVAVMLLHMVMLTFAWVQNRSVRALLSWGLGNGGMGIALTLLFLRGSIPPFLSIDVAYLILIASSGLILRGAQGFEGIKPKSWLIFGGAGVWVAACLIPSIHDSVTARTIVVSGLLSFYVGAAGYTFLYGKGEPLLSRWPLILLMGVNSILFAVRIPLALLYPLGQDAQTSITALQSPWFAVASAAVLFFNTAMNFLFLSMVKERAELIQKRTAEIDPLTGLHNRRAFLQRAELLAASGPVSLAMLDLDRFKQINDRFGHNIGDDALRIFAAIVKDGSSAGLVAGRLGGEEFAIVLPYCGSDLRRLIEKMKHDFESAAKTIGGEGVGATFSAGLADGKESVAELLRKADKALYIAKSAGRNCVLTYNEQINDLAAGAVTLPKRRSSIAA